MVIDEVKNGIYDRASLLTVDDLATLDDEVLLPLSEVLSDKVGEIFGVSNPRNYLRLKLARDSFCRMGANVMRVKPNGLYANQHQVYQGPVKSVHPVDHYRYYFLTGDGQVYVGSLNSGPERSTYRLAPNLPPFRKLQVFEFTAYGYRLDGLVISFPTRDVGRRRNIDIVGHVRDLVESLSGSRLLLLDDDGSVRRHGNNSNLTGTAMKGLFTREQARMEILPFPYRVRAIAEDEHAILKEDLSVQLNGGLEYRDVEIYAVANGGLMIDLDLNLRNAYGQIVDTNVIATWRESSLHEDGSVTSNHSYAYRS